MSYQPAVYREQGGAKLVIASGGELDVESGGAFKIAGTAVTASAAELNATSTAQGFTADTGGVAANDIAYVSGYDATNARIKLKKAQADAAGTSRDLYWCPVAVSAAAAGTGSSAARRHGVFQSTLTNSGSIGDPIYLSDGSAGAITGTKPTATDYIREVGTFISTGANAYVSIDLPGEHVPVHDHSTTALGGTLTTPALTGTTATSFEIDSDGTIPAMALGTGTTGDFTITLSPVATITAGRSVLFQDAAGTVCLTTGTPASSFTVLEGGSTARLVFDTASATGNFTHTMVVPNLGSAVSNTLPTGTAQYYALTSQADGTVVTTASTGTTHTSFEIDTDGSIPAMALNVGTTGDYTVTLQPTATLTGDRTVTFPDSAGEVCLIALSQTLSSKTLNNPTLIGGALTLSAAVTVSGTWTDLGIVTTADINGGTIDGVTIGAAAAPTVTDLGTVTTCNIDGGTIDGTAIGGTTPAAVTATNLVADSGGIDAGKDGTAGTVDIFPATGTNSKMVIQCANIGAGSRNLTITNAAQGQATTITIQDPGGAAANFVLSEGTATINGAKTFGSNINIPGILGTDATLDVTGKAGSSGVGGDITVTGGAGDGATNRGGNYTLVTGAGVNGSGAGAGSSSGAVSIASGASGTSQTGTPAVSGVVTIQTAAGGATTTSGVGAASGAVTLATGTGGASQSAANGGAAGTIALAGGTGGQDIGAGNVGGAGGAITLTGGDGGAGGTQGDGGALTFNAGNGNAEGAISIGATRAASVGIGKAGITTTVTGDLAIAAGDNITMTAGDGYIQINGASSGALKFLPTASTTSTVTITTVSCAAGRTYTLPEAGAAANFVMSEGTQTLNGVDTHTGTLDISGATVTYRAILNADIGASADIARSKLVEEAKPYAIDLSSLRVFDAVHTNLPGTPLTDDLGYVNNTWGTGSSSILTEDLKSAGATNNYAYGEFVLPAEYVDGQTCTMRFRAHAKTTAADTSMDLDVVVYKSDTEAGIGSDLCATAAQSINNTAWANKDFTITPTTLAAGDRLVYRVHTAVNDGGGGAAVIAEVGDIRFLLDVKG